MRRQSTGSAFTPGEQPRACRAELLFIVALVVVLFAVCLLGPLVILSQREYFAYTNAWNEETYLSYQGALGTRMAPGYTLSAYLVLAMHELGISGGVQNLLLDILVPLAVFLLVYGAARRLPWSRRGALLAASAAVFGSVLFNQASLWIRWLVQQEAQHFVSALASFPALLRTPNPQISYLIVALVVYLFGRRRAYWLLLLPLPFLYWSVGIPYLFIVALVFVYRRARTLSIARWILANVAGILFVGMATFALFRGAALISPGLASSRFAELLWDPKWSPTLAASALAYMVVLLTAAALKRRLPKQHHYAHVALVACQLLIANLHLVAGAQLDPRHLQDTSGATLAALSVVFAGISIGALMPRLSRAARTLGFCARWAFLLAVLSSILLSQGFDFTRFRFKIYLGLDISRDQIDRVVDDPLHAVLTWYGTSSHMPLVAPKLAIPPFSYQYCFGFINRLCPYTEDLIRRACDFVQENADENEILGASRDHLLEYARRCLEAIDADRNRRDTDDLCVESRSVYASDEFFVVEMRSTPVWAYIPSW